MIKLIAFLVIAGLTTGIFYLSYLYVTRKKFFAYTPMATFLDGPIEGEKLVIGEFTDTVLISFPVPASEQLYGVYDHIGDGFYQYRLAMWEGAVDQLGLDKTNTFRYNDESKTIEQEETDDSTNNSGESSISNNIGKI